MAGNRARAVRAAAVMLACWGCSDPAAKAGKDSASSAGADSSSSSGDLAGLEIFLSDSGPAKQACPGDSGCPCQSDGECSIGVCADDGSSPTGRACAFPAGGGCQSGFVSFTSVVGEGATVCVPAAPKLCNPCDKDGDCKATGGSGALCVDRGGSGRFCGIACPSAGCPSGYACADVTSAGGAKAKQCVPSAGAECSCSPAAIGLKLATACQIANTAGTCGGQRACGSAGLGACSGKTPAAETCNGQDDNCNGQTDEGPICDDGDACTVGDACTSGVCKPGAPKSCDDGDACTSGETCTKGNCAAGQEVICDGGQCNLGSCNKATGKCAYATKGDGTPCDDTNACTLADVCTGAVCIGQPKQCDDKDPCTLDSCTLAGDCTAATAPDGKFCDDGNACTVNETCQSGQCQGGKKAAACDCLANSDCADDGKACNGTPYCDKSAAIWVCKANPASVVVCPPTTTVCKAAACQEPLGTCGEVNLPDNSTCSDGIALTVGDVCTAGVCKGTGVQLCKDTADCAKYEDGDLCNGTLFCNKAIGSCQLNPKTVVYCPTADNTPCRANLCQPKTGLCQLTSINELKACEDGNLCTTGEACKAGVCTGTTDTCVCKADADCGKFEDGNACNGTLFCNLAIQKCELNPKTVVVCQTVNDGPCAANTCDKLTGKCGMTPKAGKIDCDADGSPCTPVDLCSNGACVADTANVCQCVKDADCLDDGDLCNGLPYCDKAKNVCKVNPATVVACNLSGDTSCTVTACNPATGKCAKTDTAWPCSDGDACTVGDQCGNGECKAGAYTCGTCQGAAECDDGNPCTDDSCTGQPLACAHKFNIAACADGDPCTTGDVCIAGACAGKAVDCDDGEVCTTDACKNGGCIYLANNAATCTDGDACTADDFCLNKNCKSGQGKTDCDDKLPCTADSCDIFKGCLHKDDASLCDDKNACTIDTCSGGNCGYTDKNCGDSNPCTNDSCDAVKGCSNAANTATCTDGNACTVGDKCAAGLCLPGAATICDDANQCTADSCDPAKGCVVVKLADGQTCTDSDPCTTGDSCKSGQCVGVAAPCLNAVGCPASGAGGKCANGQGICDNGHCFQTDAKGYKWTLVPPGAFWMGCNPSADGNCSGAANENPQHQVELSAYWVGVYEVTADIYKKCVVAGAGGCSLPASTGGANYSTYGATGKEQYPVNFINWAQSQAVCNWLGGDLPSEAQWEKAARGGCEAYAGKDCKTSVSKYPWGNVEPVCGQHAALYIGYYCGGVASPFAVGAASPDGASPYGSYDMAGNVWEWVADWYDSGFYATPAATAKNAANTTASSARVLRGGSHNTLANSLRSSFRFNYDSTLAADTGVRCAKPMLEILCDGKDDNGNGQTDEGCDDDGDLYCDATLTTIGVPAACPKGGNDCNDTSASVSPAASEICANTADDNCNGATDEAACLNGVGCPVNGKGAACGNGQGTCDSGHCLQTDAKGHKWTLVPAGKFWMGCNAAVDSGCKPDESPQHLVDLSAYWIGVYEVTAGVFKNCVTAGACTAPLTGTYCNYGPAGKEQHPANCADWSQSQAVCKWLGGDLPTEAQWEKAARGGCEIYPGVDCKTAEAKYPWGNTEPVCGTHAVFNVSGMGCGTGSTYAVGTGSPQGASPYGAYDMAGNVWEWNLDWYGAAYFATPEAAAKDPVNTAAAANHLEHGGGFVDGAGLLRLSIRGNIYPTYAGYNLGMRCAKPFK